MQVRAAVVGAVLFAALAASCTRSGGAQEAELQEAVAPSTHYVRLRFSGPLGPEHLNVARYRIRDPAGRPLRVEAARQEGLDALLLVTEAQQAVPYALQVEGEVHAHAHAEQASQGLASQRQGLHAVVNFPGSTLGETHLVQAVAVSNTQVVLLFSGKLRPRPNAPAEQVGAYAIESPNLTVTRAELSSDGSSVLLTTSPQEGLDYTVRVHALEVPGLNGTLLDPTRATAPFRGRTLRDETAPRLLAASALDNETLVLRFDEPLSADAADVRHFTVTPALTLVDATAGAFGTQLTLRTLPMVAGVTYTVRAGEGVRDVARLPLDPAHRSASFSSPALSDGKSQPRVVGATSTSNTTVVVRFSKPMDDAAVAPSSYAVVQENVNPEVGFLGVRRAAFTDARRVAVELTTYSQNEVTYRVLVSNVADLAGNPLADRVVSGGVLVDPTTAVFPGTPPGSRTGPAMDSDGDGLEDHVEARGWGVNVLGVDGALAPREVTSDPGDPDLPRTHPANVAAQDTDGDGLSDKLERLMGSDPRSRDTDRDSLDDYEEYNVLLSNQNAVDTDGDGIDDFLEVEFFKTDALVDDSDGDGYDDAEELFARGRDPRVADLPQHAVELGAVQLRIDERFTYTDETGTTRTETSNTSTALNTEQSSSTLTQESFTVFQSGGAEFGLDACQSDCGSVSVATFVNRLFAKFHGEGGQQKVEQTDSASARSAQEAYARSLEKGAALSATASVTREVVGAEVVVGVTLRNPGSVAISLSHVELTLLTTDPQDPGRLVVVAALVPQSTLATGEPATFHLGPGESRGPVAFANRDVFPALVEDLMRSPRGLVTRVANFTLVTGDGRNFAQGLQQVRERTAGIFIDPGDGRPQQFQAITAGVLDRPRDELRCGPYGDHPGALCATDAECGTSSPCQGGRIVGGFAGYGGTGARPGIPLDFLLQSVLGLRRTVAGDAAAEPDGILAGPDLAVDTVARGDDVQLVPVGTRGVPPDATVVAAGHNGVLDSVPADDDVAQVVTGYEVSRTCSANTPFAILAGQNGVAESGVTTGVCLVAYGRAVAGGACVQDADCGEDVATGRTGTCDDTDVQRHPQGASGLAADAVVVGAGTDGFVASVPGGDDVYFGPGRACTADAQCQAPGLTGGSCSGPQKVVRVGGRRDGQFRRFWTLLLPDDVQFQTDFGQLQVRAGDVVGLKFVQDVDRDGLSSEVEQLAGSSDFRRDTDGDTLGDFAEVRVGWEVGVTGSPLRRVFPDPRVADTDGDGLRDAEELDVRPLRCACDAAGPRALVGFTGTACASDAACGGTPGACRDAVACSAEDFLAGRPCAPCAQEPTLARTDPRRADTDGDLVRDADEVFGYRTGAGIQDATFAQVILAGPDRVANTRACPRNHCDGNTAQHCASDGDCQNRRCMKPEPCDDVQVVPFGSGGWSPRTVVVAPGALLAASASGGLVMLQTAAAAGDVLEAGGANATGNSRTVGDDMLLVAEGQRSHEGVLADRACVDGSTFPLLASSTTQGLARRFALCGLIKPGPDGLLQSLPGLDDVVVPAGFGQRMETTDPLSPDTDMDDVRDGFERALGSSPSDPGDTGTAGDLDRDGITDNRESSGWTVTVYPVSTGPVSRSVSSNPYVGDTDLDGLPDYAELFMPCAAASGAVCPTDPTSPDTDGDGLRDVDELPQTVLTQLEGYSGFFPGYVLNTTGASRHGTDPLRADTDGDGLSDHDELFRPFTVALSSGLLRTVTTNPRERDTDRDGASDSAERNRLAGATDPTDADTDDDGKLDGREIAAGSDPLVADLLVTVSFQRIEVDQIQDSSGAEDPDFGWWFLLRAPRLTSPTLVSSAAKFGADDLDTDGDGFTDNGGPDLRLVYNLSGTDNCLFVPLAADRHHSLPLNQGRTFSLKAGESFSVDGLLAELDPGTSSDCGKAPEYVPTALNSQCYTRFAETYSYSELSFGQRGETLAINPVDGTVEGGDTCAWQVQMLLTVE
jgi:hypothetical protein